MSQDFPAPLTVSTPCLRLPIMTSEPPSEQAPYPAPIPDWLEKGETPTPEQEREELLRLARIFEKELAEAKASTI